MPKLKWDSMLAFAGMHVMAAVALFNFSWKGFWVFLFLQWLTGAVGICLCYHRLLAHRSFQVPKPLEYLMTLAGCLAWQNGPIKWVATHRMHHARSDAPDDPHTPNKGFWWAHMGWLFTRNEEIDQFERYRDFAPDLAKDPVHRFLNRTFGYYQILLAIGLYLWGGWSCVLWGIFLRTVFMWHATWLVNSAAHTWGYRTWALGDRSTNNWWVALVSYGEGWHNNHHAFLRSAAHGLRWWEVDVTYLTIRTLERLRLASQIQMPSAQQRERQTRAPAVMAA